MSLRVLGFFYDEGINGKDKQIYKVFSSAASQKLKLTILQTHSPPNNEGSTQNALKRVVRSIVFLRGIILLKPRTRESGLKNPK